MTVSELLNQNSTSTNVSAITHLQNIKNLVTDAIFVDSDETYVIEEEDICMTSFEDDVYIIEDTTQIQEEDENGIY